MWNLIILTFWCALVVPKANERQNILKGKACYSARLKSTKSISHVPCFLHTSSLMAITGITGEDRMMSTTRMGLVFLFAENTRQCESRRSFFRRTDRVTENDEQQTARGPFPLARRLKHPAGRHADHV
jgi:hypothetical protein